MTVFSPAAVPSPFSQDDGNQYGRIVSRLAARLSPGMVAARAESESMNLGDLQGVL